MSGNAFGPFYDIWLQYNSTCWIEVPQTLLNLSSHVPQIPSNTSQFLGTGLPTAYVAIAAVVIVSTLVAGTTFLLMHKKAMH